MTVALLFIIIGALDVFTRTEVPDGSPAPQQAAGGDSSEVSSNNKTAGTDPAKERVPDKGPDGRESVLGDADTSGGTGTTSDGGNTETAVLGDAGTDGVATAAATSEPEVNVPEGGRNLTRYSANIDGALFAGGTDAVFDGRDANARIIGAFLSRQAWRANTTRGDDANFHDASDGSDTNAIAVESVVEPPVVDTLSAVVEKLATVENLTIEKLTRLYLSLEELTAAVEEPDGTELDDGDDAVFHDASDGGDTKTALPDDAVTMKCPSAPPVRTRLLGSDTNDASDDSDTDDTDSTNEFEDADDALGELEHSEILRASTFSRQEFGELDMNTFLANLLPFLLLVCVAMLAVLKATVAIYN